MLTKWVQLIRPSLSQSMEVCPLKSMSTCHFIVCSNLITAATQSGAFTQTLVFLPNDNSSCIDFTVIDDIIALEDPEEFVWTLVPIPVPSVDLGTNSTRIIIIDDDSKSILIISLNIAHCEIIFIFLQLLY